MIGLPTKTHSRISSDEIAGFRADLADQDADRLAHGLGHAPRGRRDSSSRRRRGSSDPRRSGSAGWARRRRRACGRRAARRDGRRSSSSRCRRRCRRRNCAGPARARSPPGRRGRDRRRRSPSTRPRAGFSAPSAAGGSRCADCRAAIRSASARSKPVGVAERLLHVGLVHLDVAELDDRIALDDARLGALPDDLPVDLHVLRHVDDEVALDGGRAGEAALPSSSPRLET